VKIVILAGGLGSRLGEYTSLVPKPMINIGTKPLLWHVMQTYAKHGHRDFLVALGYKSEIIKDYFANFKLRNEDFTINLASGKVTERGSENTNWNVTLVDTGLNTMTGGRIKRLINYIGKETFMLTYGDGLADIDLKDLLNFHKAHGKLVTMTAVRPAARFGEVLLKNDQVVMFEEKPQLQNGWINGGYFVVEPEFLEFIEGDQSMLEREPLEKAVQEGQLMAYRHNGFWHCLDTKRDLEALEKMWATDAPWNKK
jgi:glucose-1-phosphate cytidylyltransferase